MASNLFNFGNFLQGVELGVPGQAHPSTPAAGQAPGTWTREQAIEAGIPYRRVPIWPPFANLAKSADIAYMPIYRSVSVGGNGVLAGVQTPQVLPFSQPTIVFARTGAAVDASGGALPVGWDPLDLFSVSFIRTTGQFIDNGVTPVIARAILGNGQNPGFFCGNGLFFTPGSSLTINITTLRDNTRADVVLWTLEEWGNVGGSPR